MTISKKDKKAFLALNSKWNVPSSDGKSYLTDCADTKSLFRLIQSVPSPKAEPFKLWLAKVGYERIQEIESDGLKVNNKALKGEIESLKSENKQIKQLVYLDHSNAGVCK